MQLQWIVVGLGNPGPKYENTWHNVGFKVVDLILRKLSIESLKKQFDALVAQHRDGVALFAKPQTFMNLSGRSVRQILDFYKVEPSKLIVMFDDMDISLGQIKIRKQGGSSGHRGMESIIEELGTENFPRIRIGIGRSEKMASEDYVLSKISKECPEIFSAIERAAQSILTLLEEGLDRTMNMYNKKDSL